MTDPIADLAQGSVYLYSVLIAFLIGWAVPRGNRLRVIQLWVLRKLHNFFAYEDEKIVEAIEKTKSKIRKAK